MQQGTRRHHEQDESGRARPDGQALGSTTATTSSSARSRTPGSRLTAPPVDPDDGDEVEGVGVHVRGDDGGAPQLPTVGVDAGDGAQGTRAT
ncbi:hypothetical protein [Ornithinimicrobium flavum]|uniref:hypothetical protein n=1 Tax=Ornithinimicrobium flavum TaxID=1288636 RepID=UPI00106FE912|nr:hypothetical protein [Ornithinimicrobium flavum]